MPTCQSPRRAKRPAAAVAPPVSISAPTKAIVAPYQLDARRCIGYHTIEMDEPIPTEFREAMGNRVFGCDDCQLVCPWNRYADIGDQEFSPRHGWEHASLGALWA